MKVLGLAAAMLLLAGCVASLAHAQTSPAQPALTPVTEFAMPNGMRVMFHVDRSDPIVAVALAVHVGSARELPNRTGLAHLFEHLLFLGSENLGPGGHDRLSARIGGSGASGNTSRDVTVFHQTAPANALEPMLWAEADRLGFFIRTLSEEVLARERRVVLSEIREETQSRPYGGADAAIASALHPSGHPYGWTVLGSPSHVEEASLDDLRAFHQRWYSPNNSVLVVAGDFDPGQARRWAEGYFGEIPRGPASDRAAAAPARPPRPERLWIDDPLAPVPELVLAWPTVPVDHPDSAALIVLAAMLEAQLATADPSPPVHSSPEVVQEGGELGGALTVRVRAAAGIPLGRVSDRVAARLAGFAAGGITPANVDQARAQRERELYAALESLEDRAQFIARFAATTGDAGFADRLGTALRAVTAADVARVREAYLGQPGVALSVVPAGRGELALPGSSPVPEAAAPADPLPTAGPAAAVAPARASPAFDRSVEPPLGPVPAERAPAVWSLARDGLAVSGITTNERPVVAFEVSIDGGLIDDWPRPGAAALLARVIGRGTARRTPAELDEALARLGAEIRVEAENEHILLSGETLSRNFAATMVLLRELLSQPRLDEAQLEQARNSLRVSLRAASADPAAIARRLLNLAVLGPDSPLAADPAAVAAGLDAISRSDLRGLLARRLAAGNVRIRFVGAVTPALVRQALAGFALPAPDRPERSRHATVRTERPRLIFYDVPGAVQSTLLLGAPGPRRGDPDFYTATVTNFALGGDFTSRLVREVREARGYTARIRSRFEGGHSYGMFTVSASVRADLTLEAAALISDIVQGYGADLTDTDLRLTRHSLGRGRVRALEKTRAKLALLRYVGDFGLPADYPARDARSLGTLSLSDMRAVADRYLRPDAMTLVVVGDAQSQAARLEALGLGPPLMFRAEARR